MAMQSTHTGKTRSKSRDTEVPLQQPSALLNERPEEVDGGWVGGVDEGAAAGVQGLDLQNIVLIEREVEQLEVLPHALLVAGLGEHDDPPLDKPAQDNLGGRLSVALGDREDPGVSQNPRRPGAERGPCLVLDAGGDHQVVGRELLAQRVRLDLVHVGRHAAEGAQVGQANGQEVARPDRADLALLIKADEVPPRAVVVGEGLVQQDEVEVVGLDRMSDLSTEA